MRVVFLNKEHNREIWDAPEPNFKTVGSLALMLSFERPFNRRARGQSQYADPGPGRHQDQPNSSFSYVVG